MSDKSSKRFKGSCWKESEWRSYTGSSKELNAEILENGIENYTFHIVRQCVCKSHLHYSEVEELVLRGVLWRQLENESPAFYNKAIPGTRFKINNYAEHSETKI